MNPTPPQPDPQVGARYQGVLEYRTVIVRDVMTDEQGTEVTFEEVSHVAPFEGFTPPRFEIDSPASFAGRFTLAGPVAPPPAPGGPPVSPQERHARACALARETAQLAPGALEAAARATLAVGARVVVGYFGRMRTGTIVKVGRTRYQVSVRMPSTGRVWVKWFPMSRCRPLAGAALGTAWQALVKAVRS